MYNKHKLPEVLYGYDVMKRAREEHRLNMFENRNIRWIFGAKNGELEKKYHNEELHDMYRLSHCH